MPKNVETYYQDNQWKNKVQGNKRASSVHSTKTEAQKAGRQQAQSLGTEHLIKNKDGKIGARNSYGNDPHPPRG